MGVSAKSSELRRSLAILNK